MTIGSQVKQTLASLKGVQATLETMASIEENKNTKSVLDRNIQKIDTVISGFENRLKVLEFEEPTYKGF